MSHPYMTCHVQFLFLRVFFPFTFRKIFMALCTLINSRGNKQTGVILENVTFVSYILANVTYISHTKNVTYVSHICQNVTCILMIYISHTFDGRQSHLSLFCPTSLVIKKNVRYMKSPDTCIDIFSTFFQHVQCCQASCYVN